MRKYLFMAAILTGSLSLLSSCSDNDSETIVEDPNKITLNISKNSIQANGVDAINYSVMRGGSEEITSRSQLMVIQDTDTMMMGRGVTSFSTLTPGTYTLRASYYESGLHYSDNSIEITASESQPSKYAQKVFGMQFTSVYCTYCPELSTNIKLLMDDENYNQKIVPASFHKDFGGADPMTFKFTDNYFKLLGGVGLPSFYLDFRKESTCTVALDNMRTLIDKTLESYPTICGVAIESDYNESTRALKVTTKVKSDFDNSNYKIMVFLVEDNIEAAQYGSTDLFYKHNNVVRDILCLSYMGDKLGDVEAEVEKTKTYSYTIPANWKTGEMRIISCILNSVDGGTTHTVSNTTMCDLGSSIDYQYKN